MNIIKSIVDNVGDVLGTSKLAKLNSTLFEPVIGMQITREEYEMCDGPNFFNVPTEKQANALKGLDQYDRKMKADKVLSNMVDNGTVFSDRRIMHIAAAMQTRPGEDAVPYKVSRQMSDPGKKHLRGVLHEQANPSYSRFVKSLSR